MSEGPPSPHGRGQMAGNFARLIAGAALVVFALLPQRARCVAAHDSRHRPMRWLQKSIAIEVVRPRPSTGFTAGDVSLAAKHAARGWEAEAVPLLEIKDSGVLRTASEDGVNVVVVRDNSWCSESNPENCYDVQQVAVTHPFARVRDPHSAVAEIVEADVEVNANHPYLSSASSTDKKIRLEAILTHEFGHLLGLDHDCSATHLSSIRDRRGAERPLCSDDNASMREEAMFPGLTEENRPAVLTPTEGERNCASSIYGKGWLDALSVPWSRGLRLAVAILLGFLLVVLGRSARSPRSVTLAEP